MCSFGSTGDGYCVWLLYIKADRLLNAGYQTRKPFSFSSDFRHQTIRFQIAHWKGFPPDIKKRQEISPSLFIVWRIAGVNKIGLRIDGTGYAEKPRTTGSKVGKNPGRILETVHKRKVRG